LEGIRDIEVDLEEKIAIVVYESAIVEPSSMIKATSDIGFPSSIKPPEK